MFFSLLFFVWIPKEMSIKKDNEATTKFHNNAKKKKMENLFFITHTTINNLFCTRSEMNIIHVKFVVFRLTVAGDTRVACVMFGVDSVSLKFDVDVVIVVICC